jgi:hypothetical protein
MASRKQKALAQQTKTVERRVFLGIGDAVLRLIHVERMYADGVDPSEELTAERDLIVQALNQQYQLDLGMDCDEDGIPDAIDPDVTMLTHAAQTSCCRILPDGEEGSAQTSRVEPLPDPKPRTSRKKAVSKKEATPPKRKAPKKTPRKKPKTESKAKKPAAKKGGFFTSLFGSDEEK